MTSSVAVRVPGWLVVSLLIWRRSLLAATEGGRYRKRKGKRGGRGKSTTNLFYRLAQRLGTSA